MRRTASNRPILRAGRALWTAIAFLVCSSALIIVTSHWFLIPAVTAAHSATTRGKRTISATATLMMAVVLFALVVLVLLTFRISRWLAPRSDAAPTKTKYVDAWGEAGQRMQAPPEDEE